MNATKALRVIYLLILAFMLIMAGINGTPGAIIAAIIAPQALTSASSTGQQNSTQQSTTQSPLLGGIL